MYTTTTNPKFLKSAIRLTDTTNKKEFMTASIYELLIQYMSDHPLITEDEARRELGLTPSIDNDD